VARQTGKGGMSIVIDRLRRVSRRRFLPGHLQSLGFRRLCEVGVFSGNHLRELLFAEPLELVAIDAWQADLEGCGMTITQAKMDEFYESILELSRKHPCIKVLRMLSTDAAQQFADGYFDFVYLDANHTYSSVKSDLEAWWSKVRPGGVLAGHDYVDQTTNDGTKFGVIQSVDEFITTHKLRDNFAVIDRKGHTPFPTWLIEKP